MKRFLFIALALFIAACSKDYPIASGVKEMGSCKDGVFTSDEGISYKIVSDLSEEALGDQERVCVDFDILYPSDGGYAITVNSWWKPLVKPWLRRSALEGNEGLGEDPIRVYSGWISGGYFNLDIYVYIKKESETKHFVNLVLDDLADSPDTLRLNLTHNGYGEVPSLEELDAGDPDGKYVRGTSTACFPVGDMLPDGADEMPFKISGTWYATTDEGNYILEDYSTEGILKRR